MFRTTVSILIGTVLLILFFVFAKVEGGFLAWFLFYFYTIFAVYEFATWGIGLRKVKVERKVSTTRLSAGQSLDISITVTRSGPWPLFWLRIRDELPHRWTYQASSTERLLQPLWSKVSRYTYRVQELQRGIYRLGNTYVETGDVLGLIKRNSVQEASDEVLVYPKIIAVRNWSSSSPEESGLRQSTRRRTEESSNVLGVRAYVPGDRLSRIHWPASARRGSLQAKEFELHVTSELMFVPDLSQTSSPIAGADFELEMTIAASLLKYAYDMRRIFAMTLYGRKLQTFPAGINQALFLRCMEALAGATPDGKVDFADALTRISQEVPMGSTLVVASPRLDKAAAVAASVARRRAQVEWFVPLTQNQLTETQRTGYLMLKNARVNVYFINDAEALGRLQRGGGGIGTNVQR